MRGRAGSETAAHLKREVNLARQVTHPSFGRVFELGVDELPDGESTLKTFFREKDGRIRLQPANPEFEPIIVTDCQIQGIVTGVLRNYV